MTDWLRDRYSDMERPASDAAYLRNLHPAISAIQSQIEADAAREQEPITDQASARFLAMLVRVSGGRVPPDQETSRLAQRAMFQLTV